MEDSRPKQPEETGAGARKGEDRLLKMTKGDARTRIKRKTSNAERISVESEDGEESEAQARGGKKPGKRAGTATVTSDEEKATRPSKSKMQTTTSKDKMRKASSLPQRSKPLRVYSSDDAESEEGETVAAANGKPRSEDDDTSESNDELPAAVHLSSTSHRKTKTGSGKATVAARVKSKGRTSNSSLESELKASTTANKQQLTTPKRTVSVLVPSVTISGGSKKKSGKILDGKPGARRDKSESSIQPKLSFGRTLKPKSKFRTPVTDSSDEAEVEEIVSPRTRAAVSKDASLKTLAGQSSLKDVVNLNKRGKDRKTGKTYESSSITVSRKPSRTTLPEPMEVDDDHVPGSTPGSTASLGLPRRSAATKASRKLHETIMPDLVNFEAQLKKSKERADKAVVSTPSRLILRKMESTGKRKITGHQGDEEDSGSDDEHPKKKRRISNENDRAPPKPKSKGKQKAMDDDDIDASRLVPQTICYLIGD